MRRAVSEQIDYVGKGLEALEAPLNEVGKECLTQAEGERLETIRKVNEGTRLKEAAERYRERMGHWPKAILADTIYRNRENRRFCKEHGIRLSGPRLGRPRKDEAEEDKAQAWRDSLERNMIESRGGIAKRRYGLSRIMAYLACTGMTEAALQILVMNVAYLLRFFLRLFREWLAGAKGAAMELLPVASAA